MKNPTGDEVFAATYLYFCGEIDEDELDRRLGEPRMPHGAVVERRMEAFHDVVVYEDGYEERYYICD